MFTVEFHGFKSRRRHYKETPENKAFEREKVPISGDFLYCEKRLFFGIKKLLYKFLPQDCPKWGIKKSLAGYKPARDILDRWELIFLFSMAAISSIVRLYDLLRMLVLDQPPFTMM